MAFNILIVDDSATVRAVIAKTFQLANIPINELHQAANGKEALEVLGNHWIDLVFADINMPIMGGVEMIEKMCADGLLKTIPVVIVSTEGSATRIEQLKDKGIRAYIRKPFTPELIRKVVDDIMGVQNAN
jgi:two-component system chemotaxis response regulator CheY